MAQTGENSPDHWKSRSVGWQLSTAEAEPRDDVFNQALANAAGAGPGKDILDLAAGTGEPCISMAKMLQGAKTGSVTATDLTFEMLSVAKRRAALLEYSNIRFAISTMEALPFADNSFDGATCRLGLMFPAEKTTCAREARRVLKPGGRVAYLCWGTLAANPVFELFARAMESYFEEEFPLRMVRYSLGEPGSIAAILEEAGFSDVREEIVSYEREIAPGDNYFRHGISRTWPESVKNFSDADWTSLLKHTEEVFSELRRGENFFIPNSANLGTGMADG